MITLTESHVSALSAASSPEEAYKVFCSAATELIGQAIADAMGRALGQASVATSGSPSIQGWEGFFKGCSCDINWGTPGFSLPPSILNTFAQSNVSGTEVDPKVLSIGFTIGVSGTF